MLLKNTPTSLASQVAVILDLFLHRKKHLEKKKYVHPGLAIEGKRERVECYLGFQIGMSERALYKLEIFLKSAG